MKTLLLCANLLACGCGTSLSFFSEPRVMGGTRIDIGAATTEERGYISSGLRTLLILDLPFSFALDVATLPITLWFEIFRSRE
jgi:uncharacterized protein YceK